MLLSFCERSELLGLAEKPGYVGHDLLLGGIGRAVQDAPSKSGQVVATGAVVIESGSTEAVILEPVELDAHLSLWIGEIEPTTSAPCHYLVLLYWHGKARFEQDL